MQNRNVRIQVSIVLLALFFICVKAASGQIITPQGASDTGLGGTNTITGTVLISTGGRLQSRVTIRLLTMTKGDRVAMTDEYGAFAFRGLVSGDYTLVIDKEKDFLPVSQLVSVIQPRGYPPQSYLVSLRLTPKPGVDAKASVVNVDLAGVPKNALGLYQKALDLAKAGDRKGAIEQLQNAIVEYPAFMLAYNEIGVQHMHLNELPKADEALQAALKIDARAYTPMMNRVIVLYMMKRYAEAEPLVRTVLTIQPNSPVGHYFLGQSLAYLGKFDEAEKELNTAVELGGEAMKEAHRLLAIIYSSQGNKTRAASELETYLRIVPTAPDAEQLKQTIERFKGAGTAAPSTSSSPKPAV